MINQDSPWKLPPSPQSSPKESNASQWKSSTSAGTEIWENAVRHKTKGPAPSPAASTPSAQPWGHHTPSTHIGGTWGEDEDPSNHWTGVPQVNNNTNNWGGNNSGNNSSSNSMQWNNSNSENRQKVNQSSNWYDSGKYHNIEGDLLIS